MTWGWIVAATLYALGALLVWAIASTRSPSGISCVAGLVWPVAAVCLVAVRLFCRKRAAEKPPQENSPQEDVPRENWTPSCN